MTRTWRDVLMPPLIARLPRDTRGYPVLFTSPIRADGTPDLTLTDPVKRLQCFHERRCGICGEVMRDVIVFVGGPQAVQNRCFGDAGMHPPCADYSRQVCPYLAARRDRHVALGSKTAFGEAVAPPGGQEEKPDLLALYATRRYVGALGHDGDFVFYGDTFLWVRWYGPDHQRIKQPDVIQRTVWPPAFMLLFPAWMSLKERRAIRPARSFEAFERRD